MRDAQEKKARARRLAEQDQGSGTSPAPAGPCAACTRSGGMCGFCKRRQELACEKYSAELLRLREELLVWRSQEGTCGW